MHFSVSSVGSVHTEPSSGNCFTYLSRDRMPVPQDMLQGDQVIHSDMVQVEPSATHGRTLQPERRAPGGADTPRSPSAQGQESTRNQLAFREVKAVEDGRERKRYPFLDQERF